MQFIIAGSSTDVDSITFSEKGFGKNLGNGNSWVSYYLKVEIDDFIQRLKKVYADCIEELIRDDKITGQFHPPYTGATAYPSLEEFIELSDTKRKEMIDTYFTFDILRAYVPEYTGTQPVRWLINSLDSVSRQGEMVVIKGELYHGGK